MLLYLPKRGYFPGPHDQALYPKILQFHSELKHLEQLEAMLDQHTFWVEQSIKDTKEDCNQYPLKNIVASDAFSHILFFPNFSHPNLQWLSCIWMLKIFSTASLVTYSHSPHLFIFLVWLCENGQSETWRKCLLINLSTDNHYTTLCGAVNFWH